MSLTEEQTKEINEIVNSISVDVTRISTISNRAMAVVFFNREELDEVAKLLYDTQYIARIRLAQSLVEKRRAKLPRTLHLEA